MKVTVKLFASFREASGSPESVIEVAPGTTVGRLWEQLVEEQPRLAPVSRAAAFAVNRRYTRAGTVLNEGDEVAFLPPMSGG